MPHFNLTAVLLAVVVLTTGCVTTMVTSASLTKVEQTKIQNMVGSWSWKNNRVLVIESVDQNGNLKGSYSTSIYSQPDVTGKIQKTKTGWHLQIDIEQAEILATVKSDFRSFDGMFTWHDNAEPVTFRKKQAETSSGPLQVAEDVVAKTLIGVWVATRRSGQLVLTIEGIDRLGNIVAKYGFRDYSNDSVTGKLRISQKLWHIQLDVGEAFISTTMENYMGERSLVGTMDRDGKIWRVNFVKSAKKPVLSD